MDRDLAIFKIQKLWRSYKQRQLYQNYRDLIKFHNEGKPQILINSVAKSESYLCDGATQLFIRFRLAGKTFPPHIVYKIFTDANICDINSFGPRNYFGEEKMAKSQYRYQKYFPQLKHEKSLSNLRFYKREENNPWRPIIAQEIIELKRQLSKQLSLQNVLLQRPGSKQLTKYEMPFHFSKVTRQKDKRLRLKKKKLKMLQKLYKIGLAIPKPLEIIEKQKEESQEILLSNRLSQRIDSKSTLKLTKEEQEIEELLDWSYNLDFDGYLMEWGSIGTSANCNLFIPEKNNVIGLSDIDKLLL